MSAHKIGYEPTPAQIPFHESRAFERLLIGGFGSGKTYALCAEAIAFMLEQPGIRGMIARQFIPALKASTEAVFVDLLPPEFWSACHVTRTAGHIDTVRFPNGSEVMFKSLSDWRQLRSINLGFLAIDEADEIDNETYEGMLSRIRQREPTGAGLAHGARSITRRGVWMAMNPSGHSWHFERFVRDGNDTRAWFRATSLDNPFLPPEYIQTLLTYPSAWVKRYVLADWGDFSGQIYEAWDSARHVVAPYPLNPHTREPGYPDHAGFWMGMDPGTENPTGALWCVVERAPRPRIVAVAEYLEADLAATVHARTWRQVEAALRFRNVRRIADPNAVTVRDRGSNNRLSDIYRRLGFRFELGPSSYDDRIPALGTLIANDQFVVTEACPLTFDAIRDARWKDLSPAQRAAGEDAREKPLKRKRELCDCAEYLAGKWVKPVLVAPQPEEGDWSWEIRQTIQARIRGSSKTKRPIVEGIPV